MSNSHENGSSKLIHIKPIQLKQKEDINPIVNKEKEIQKELLHAKEELAKTYKEREQILESAKKEIEEAKLAWEEEKIKLQETVKEQSYKEGFELGKKEGLETYRQNINQVNEVIDTAWTDYHNLLDNSDRDIVQLALSISERILKQKINQEPASFLPIVQEAIKDIKDHDMLSIYLHPENYKHVLKQKDELIQILGDKVDLSIYVSENATVGSCIIEYPFGKIDASIDTQLNEIRQALHDIVNGE